MAIANLHETILSYKLRRNALNLEITEYQNLKTLATYSQADVQSLKNAETRSVRDYFKGLWDEDQDKNGAHIYDCYADYTEIPDFEEEIDKLTAKFQDELNDLTAWETTLDAQITTDATELEEINVYLESMQSMLQSNTQEDFDYSLG